jgi:hypothetical protein
MTPKEDYVLRARRTWAQAVAAALLLPSFTLATTLDSPYTPSKSEWLRLSLLVALYERASVWRRRVGFLVAVNGKEKTVIVTVGLANGEPEPAQTAVANYEADVKAICASVLERHDWARGLTLSVKFVR